MTLTDTPTPVIARRGALLAGGVGVLGLALGIAPEAEAATITRRLNRTAIYRTARSGIGVRYRWAGTSRSGWDCSGFTMWVYKQHGVSLPHTVSGQAAMGRRISKAQAVRGDLVVWPGHHVGIYAGNGRLIDAGSSRTNTTERRIWGSPRFYRIGR